MVARRGATFFRFKKYYLDIRKVFYYQEPLFGKYKIIIIELLDWLVVVVKGPKRNHISHLQHYMGHHFGRT